MGNNPSAETALSKSKNTEALVVQTLDRISKLESTTSNQKGQLDLFKTRLDGFTVSENNKYFDAEVSATGTYKTVKAALVDGKRRIKVSSSTTESGKWSVSDDTYIYIDNATVTMGSNVYAGSHNLTIEGAHNEDSEIIVACEGNDFVETSSPTKTLIFKNLKLTLTSGVITANMQLGIEGCKVGISSTATTDAYKIYFSQVGGWSNNTEYILRRHTTLNVDMKYGEHTTIVFNVEYTSDSTARNIIVDDGASGTRTGARLTEATFKGNAYVVRVSNNGAISNLNTSAPKIFMWSSGTGGGANYSSLINANLGAGYIENGADHSHQKFENVSSTGSSTLGTSFLKTSFNNCQFSQSTGLTIASLDAVFSDCYFAPPITCTGRCIFTDSTFLLAFTATCGGDNDILIRGCRMSAAVVLTGTLTSMARMDDCTVDTTTALSGYTSVRGSRLKGAVTMTSNFNLITDTWADAGIILSGSNNKISGLKTTTYEDNGTYTKLSNSNITGTFEISDGNRAHVSNTSVTGITTITSNYAHISNVNFTGAVTVSGDNCNFNNIITAAALSVSGSYFSGSNVECGSNLSLTTGTNIYISGLYVGSATTISTGYVKIDNFRLEGTLGIDSDSSFVSLSSGYVNGAMTLETNAAADRHSFKNVTFVADPTTLTSIESTFDACTFTALDSVSSGVTKCRFINCVFEDAITLASTYTDYVSCQFDLVVTATADLSYNKFLGCHFVVTGSNLDGNRNLQASCIYVGTLTAATGAVDGSSLEIA